MNTTEEANRIARQFEKSEAESKRRRDKTGGLNRKIIALRTANAELEKEVERQRDALERIQTWSKAYPLTAFPKPDLKKARKALEAAGMTLDAISGDAMRHVLEGVKDIVEKALKNK